jgi:hypothetical protein
MKNLSRKENGRKEAGTRWKVVSIKIVKKKMEIVRKKNKQRERKKK